MATPRIDAVLDGLVATLQAYSGLCAEGGTGVPVYDGPVATSAPTQQYVVVGWDGDPESVGVAVDVQQQWHDMGPGADRDEELTVTCVLVCQDGSADFASLRTTAGTTFGLVSNALRATPGLGITEALWCEISRYQYQQAPDGLVRIVFEVIVRTFI